MSKRTEHDPSLVLDPEEARRLARALQSPPKLGPEAEAELQRRAEESRATLPPKPAAWSPGGVNPFSGIVAGLFALLLMVGGEARADTRVLVDLYPEWQVREACRLEREGDLPPWWVDVCGEPQPPVSPNLPPVSEDDGEEPPLPPSGCWTTPSGQRLCPGEDGRGLTFGEFAELLGGLGMFDTEDGADDTPTLDDPSEFVEHNPLGTDYRSGPTIEVPPLVLYEPAQPPTPEPTPDGTPTAAPVEPTPAACPPGTTPLFGGLFCLDYWTPGGDWRVDWGIEPDLREVEHGQPCGQEGEPPCPGANHPQPEPCPPNREPCNIGCCWEAGRPPPDGEVVID